MTLILCCATVALCEPSALLRGGTDILEGPVGGEQPTLLPVGVDQPTPLAIAKVALAQGKAKAGSAAFLILAASKPWSRKTHDLYPAPARARAVELMLIGELLSREERFAAYGPQAVVDAWMTFVVPQAVSRNHVQVVGLKGRADLNGQKGTIGQFNEAKGRYPVHLEGGEAVMIKMMNLMTV